MALTAEQNQAISNFVAANIDNPTAIANAASQYGVSLADLANATGYSANDVQNYFSNAGINTFSPSISYTPAPDSEGSQSIRDNYSINGKVVNPIYGTVSGAGDNPNAGAISGVTGFSGGIEHINGRDYTAQYDASGNLLGYRPYAGSSTWSDLSPVIGMAAMAFGVPGIIGSSMGLTGAAATAAGGAVLGGGTAAMTGGNVLKGAALGGAMGYAGGQLGEYLNQGVTDPNLLQQAADADMAAGMLPQYGTNAAYDSAMQNLMANSPGAVQQLQNIVSGQVGGTYGPDNIDVGGGYNPATGSGDLTTANAAGTIGAPSGGNIAGGAGVTGAVNAAGAGSALSNLTSNPLGTAALVNAGAGLLSSGINSNAISNALNTQSQAAQTAGSTLKDIYNQQLGFVQPYQQAGLQALDLLGKNKDYLTHQFNAQDLAAGLAPNYDFMLQQGQMANQRAANVGGGAIGGNALQGLQKFTQDYAGNAYQNAFNNYQTQRSNIFNTLNSIAGYGQTANQQAIGAGTNYGQQQTNLATGLAAAQAGANVGQAQNQTNLISNLANNVTLASLLGQKQAVA